MNKKSPNLQLKLENLRLERDILKEEAILQRELGALKRDIRDLGGDSVYNFKQDITKLGILSWTCLVFILGGLFNSLDTYLQGFNEDTYK